MPTFEHNIEHTRRRRLPVHTMMIEIKLLQPIAICIILWFVTIADYCYYLPVEALLFTGISPPPSSVLAFSSLPLSSSSSSLLSSSSSLLAETINNNNQAEAEAAIRAEEKHYDTATFTYLEINGWILNCGGVTLLIDPILEGKLDFGIPWAYTASRSVLGRRQQHQEDTINEGGGEEENLNVVDGNNNNDYYYGRNIESLPLQDIDALLITQGLDDHAHERTLRKLAKAYAKSNNVALPKVFCPPSAYGVVKKCGFESDSITCIASKNRRIEVNYFGLNAVLPKIKLIDNNVIDEVIIRSSSSSGAATSSGNKAATTIDGGGGLSVTATSGALVGPPWQRRENGYIIRSIIPNENKNVTANNREIVSSHYDDSSSSSAKTISIYIEPHVEFDEEELSRLGPVDVVITPITGQALPGFELVHGPDEALKLIEILQPTHIAPMANGNVDSSGFVSSYIKPLEIEIESSLDDVELFQKKLEKKYNSGLLTSNAEVLRVPAGKSFRVQAKKKKAA